MVHSTSFLFHNPLSLQTRSHVLFYLYTYLYGFIWFGGGFLFVSTIPVVHNSIVVIVVSSNSFTLP